MCNFVIFAWNLQVTLLTDFLQVYMYQCRRDWVTTDCISADYKSGRHADWSCQYCHCQCRRQSDPMHSHLTSSHMYDMQPVAMQLQLPFTMPSMSTVVCHFYSSDYGVVICRLSSAQVHYTNKSCTCVGQFFVHWYLRCCFWYSFAVLILLCHIRCVCVSEPRLSLTDRHTLCVYQNHVCH